MSPLSVQPVTSRGFALYFYAFTDERPPAADLQAVENRTWVYQRPYTVLEFQHLHSDVNLKRATASESGFTGAICSGLSQSMPNIDWLAT